MPHNFVVTRPGSLEEVGLLAEATATQPDALKRQYVPGSDKILLASRLLQPRGYVDGISGHKALSTGRVSCDHLTRVHTDPDLDPNAVIALQFDVQRLQRLAHAARCPNRADGIVLVRARDAEDRHHRITDELLHRAAVRMDHELHLIEEATHHATESLRIQALSECGRAGYVGEQDRHDFSHLGGALLRTNQRRRALLTEPCAIRVLFTACSTCAHGAMVGH